MNRLIPIQVITIVCISLQMLTSLVNADDGQIGFEGLSAHYPKQLASRFFEGEDEGVGPDSYFVVNRNYGEIRRSSWSASEGQFSARVIDYQNAGMFPELQGYFPEITEGKLWFHFAFMTPKPREDFEIALAGKNHFTLAKKHGINFWLSNQDSTLYHYVNNKPESLFTLEAHIWYYVDLILDIHRGTSSLTIKSNDGRVLVANKETLNASGQKESTSVKYSFIGDLDDKKSADYFVDEVIVATNSKIDLKSFKAPGRRDWFVDIWSRKNLSQFQSIKCVPIVNITDVGISEDEFDYFESQGFKEELYTLLDGSTIMHSKEYPEEITALIHWSEACDALGENNYKKALHHASIAHNLQDDASLYLLTKRLIEALLNSNNIYSFTLLEADWYGDSRFAVMRSMLAMHSQQIQKAKVELLYKQIDSLDKIEVEMLPNIINEVVDKQFIGSLRMNGGQLWALYIQHFLILEQYFYALMAQGEYYEAQMHAKAVIEALKKRGLNSSKWLSYAGDASFQLSDFSTAKDFYLESVNAGGGFVPQTNLADIYFLLGEKKKEAKIREDIYGRMFEEGEAPRPER